VRRSPYASWSMRTRRSTRLGFQPPAIGDEEVAAVAETLRSGWLTTGPRAALLEERLADTLEADHVLALSSGTAALHLALVALGIGAGDEVITSPITWPATANVIDHCGATPVFCDVREDDLTIDPARAAELVSARTKAILPVDLAGQPADLDAVRALGLPVVEDAAHAFEARYRGRKVGAVSDVTCFSLYATKNLAAGEGGVLATNRVELADAVRAMRLTRREAGGVYDQVGPGFKANLPDVFAAIALVQLDKLEAHLEVRAHQFELYDEAIDDLDGITPLARDPRDRHAHHLYVVRIDPETAGATRDDYRAALGEELVSTSIHFLPVHTLTWFRKRLPRREPLPVAERAGREVLSLPVSPVHSDDDILDAADALRRAHARFTG
jgi:dTDP-4-amino-4,6-dideoxygalactose transaminase